jgi:hypothetical protein
MGESHKEAQKSQEVFQLLCVFCASLWPFLLAVVAYAPAVNNGFIADDYVYLQQIELMKVQPLYLLHLPPANFRLFTYAVFAFLKSLVGYDARFFYAVNIAIHVVNIALFRRLLAFVVHDEFVSHTAAILFAVFQAPQEAIMWVAAMHETTLAFFALITLLMWWQKRYTGAAAAYAMALFSKESGIVLLLLIALLDLKQGQRKPYRAYALLLIPTGIFAAIFVATISTNFMITSRSYTLGPQAIFVLLLSLHRLVWPWLYIILVLVWLTGRATFVRRTLPRLPLYLACVVVPMLPYMFIAYQASLPSRQLYMSSAVLMAIFALMLKSLERTTLLRIFMIAFVGFNVGYLWIRKDAQFEDRAAPTTQLVAALRKHTPQPTLVLNFPYPYPDIAQASALAVPGWRSELILVKQANEVNGPGLRCENCLKLSWNAHEKKYE